MTSIRHLPCVVFTTSQYRDEKTNLMESYEPLRVPVNKGLLQQWQDFIHARQSQIDFVATLLSLMEFGDHHMHICLVVLLCDHYELFLRERQDDCIERLIEWIYQEESDVARLFLEAFQSSQLNLPLQLAHSSGWIKGLGQQCNVPLRDVYMVAFGKTLSKQQISRAAGHEQTGIKHLNQVIAATRLPDLSSVCQQQTIQQLTQTRSRTKRVQLTPFVSVSQTIVEPVQLVLPTRHLISEQARKRQANLLIPPSQKLESRSIAGSFQHPFVVNQHFDTNRRDIYSSKHNTKT